jgi:hypothetical protein
MPRYVTDVDRWISHECRLVKAGEVFETTFPEGMKLGETLREIKPEKLKKAKSDAPQTPENPPAEPPAGDDLT